MLLVERNTIQRGEFMAKYTNLGLVNHAKMALGLKTKYMWGGILRTIEKQYDMLKSIYGTKPGTGYTDARWQELASLKNQGWYGVDCVGLVKSYYWSGKANGGVGSPEYCSDAYPDVPATTMYNKAKKKGAIKTMPETPGLIVYSKSHPHVGIYIGNGETIESTLGSRGDGVVKRKLDNFWEYWFECPYISYVKPTQPKPTTTTFKVGDKVKVKKTATYYAGSASKTKIPEWVKGNIYTIGQINGTMSLLKEIFSWVKNEDLEKV